MTILICSQGAREFFERYLAASFLLHGMDTVQEWVSQTIDPGSETPHQPTVKVRSSPSTGFGHAQQPMPPPGAPPVQPPPPSYYSPGHARTPPLQPSSASSNVQILSQFNMTAQKNHYTVTYPARSEGPSHSPTWYVECCRKLGLCPCNNAYI